MAQRVELTWTNGDIVTTENVLQMDNDDPLFTLDGEDTGTVAGDFAQPNKFLFEDDKGFFFLTAGQVLDVKVLS